MLNNKPDCRSCARRSHRYQSTKGVASRPLNLVSQRRVSCFECRLILRTFDKTLLVWWNNNVNDLWFDLCDGRRSLPPFYNKYTHIQSILQILFFKLLQKKLFVTSVSKYYSDRVDYLKMCDLMQCDEIKHPPVTDTYPNQHPTSEALFNGNDMRRRGRWRINKPLSIGLLLMVLFRSAKVYVYQFTRLVSHCYGARTSGQNGPYQSLYLIITGTPYDQSITDMDDDLLSQKLSTAVRGEHYLEFI